MCAGANEVTWPQTEPQRFNVTFHREGVKYNHRRSVNIYIERHLLSGMYASLVCRDLRYDR